MSKRSEDVIGRLPDPRNRNLSSRRRALAAGLEALLRQADSVLTDGLHRKRIASISGQSRQTLYQHFPDHDEYVAALLGLILDPTDEAWPVEDPALTMQLMIERAPANSPGIVHEIAESNFLDRVDNEHWALGIVAWAIGRHRPEVRDALARQWSFYSGRTAEALAALLDHWDATLAPPFDLERAAQLFDALGDGLALRAWVLDPEDASLFCDGVAAIAHAVVVPRDAEISRFEPQLPDANREPVGDLTPTDMDTVLYAAMRCYEDATRAPSLTAIAREARVAESSITQHFGGNAGIVVALWDRFASDLARGYRGLDGDMAPLARLRAQLAALIHLGVSCPELTSQFVVIISSAHADSSAGLSRSTHDAVSAPFEDLLRVARQAGHLDFAVPPRVLAMHLVATTLGTSATFPRPHGTRQPDIDQILERVWLLAIDASRVTDEANT